MHASTSPFLAGRMDSGCGVFRSTAATAGDGVDDVDDSPSTVILLMLLLLLLSLAGWKNDDWKDDWMMVSLRL